MKHIGYILAGLLLLGSACGESGGGGGGGGGGENLIAIGDYAENFSIAFCSKTFECCTTEEISDRFSFFGGFTDEADCVTQFTSLLTPLQAEIQVSIDSGNLIYHADLARDCISLGQSATCEEFNQDDYPGGACDTFLEGLLADAATCSDDNECASGYCEGDSAEPSLGVCKVPPSLGSPCPDSSCPKGSYCPFGLEPKCRAKQADGESCISDEGCLKVCNFDIDDNGICGDAITCNGL